MQRRKCGLFTGKKTLIETSPEVSCALDLLDRDFRSNILNMLKVLNETVDKEKGFKKRAK